jgi:hypothetical protein
VDNSAEEDGEAIFRIKSEFRADILMASFDVMGRKVTLQAQPKATGWYDALNSEFYYSVGADFEIDLGDDKDFVLQYLKGSGAPNFNEGDQFGAFLKIAF